MTDQYASTHAGIAMMCLDGYERWAESQHTTDYGQGLRDGRMNAYANVFHLVTGRSPRDPGAREFVKMMVKYGGNR